LAKSLIQYRVFIGSPGGLEEERKKFRDVLQRCTKLHAEPQGVLFYPAGWEDTIGGVGRPQALINKDIEDCDYAVFILHDRWGTQSGGGYSSGTEEEWRLAEKLYKETKILNMVLFFKQVSPTQLRDPGEQLKQVLAFRREIEQGQTHFFKTYTTIDELAELFEAQLAGWLRAHTSRGKLSLGESSPSDSRGVVSPAAAAEAAPNFEYWMAEARGLLDEFAYSEALFCAKKALSTVTSDLEWARAQNIFGFAHYYLKNPDEALSAFAAIAEHFQFAGNGERRDWRAKALFNKGVTLGQLGRSEDE
jgi:tetratricopeptide (TPR) repeat protein